MAQAETQHTETVEVTIDDETYDVDENATVLAAATRNGIEIPTLCHMDGLADTAACRMCLVETGDGGDPVAACSLPVEDGMTVRTQTDRLRRSRKNTIELLLSENCADCLTCEQRGGCELAELAYEYDVDMEAYAGGGGRFEPMTDNPYFELDHDKCILCGRCVQACDEVRHNSAIGFTGRGMETKVSPPLDRSLVDTECKFCGQCIDSCPTGALTAKDRIGAGRESDLETTSTICTYCGVGCRIEFKHMDGEIVDASIVDDPETAPANGNRMCVKGRFAWDFVNDDERLTQPLIREDGELREASWEEALDYTAERLQEIREEHGADAVAGLASATCTNEENYVYQKFMRAAFGTNNIDHCARLCHASTVAGLGRAFGSGAMTNSNNEIRDADAILITGSNTTEAHPVLGLEVQEAVENGADLILVDPREIEIADDADLHLRQTGGTDIAWVNGMLNVILEEGLVDEEFVEERTENFEELKETVQDYPPEKVEEIAGIDAEKLREAARMYAEADRASILYAMGITQHSSGTDNVLSLANLAMATGNLGRESTGVNPLRGQNNVQGACDLGALPDVYPGYQAVDDPEINETFEEHWNADLPEDPGLTITEMIDAARFGKVKGMYVMGENPMVSDPHLRHVQEGLEELEFLVVQDIFVSETAELADVILPAKAFAEKEGTFTNTERRIQPLSTVVDAPGDAKEDWEIVDELAERFDYPMEYDSVHEITDEIAAVTPIYGGIVADRLDEQGLQWPCEDEDDPGTKFLYADDFNRENGLGKFHGVEYLDPDEIPDDEYPFRLSTGRMLYHFHTRTMTGRSRAIMEHVPDPYVELNPEDAEAYGVEDGERIEVASRRGEIEIPAYVTDRVPAGTIFIPFHFAESAANKLTNPTVDPKSKIPELKVCAARIETLD